MEQIKASYSARSLSSVGCHSGWIQDSGLIIEAVMAHHTEVEEVKQVRQG